MKSVEFCYWLQGMFEINPPTNGLTKEQVSIIKKHLDMVFYHEIDNSYPSEQQDALNKFHNEVKQAEPVEVKPQYMPNVDKKEEHVIYPIPVTPSKLEGVVHTTGLITPVYPPVPPKPLYPTTDPLMRC